ncbi:hypothetical protein NDA16_002870 [Ustilago loliicola]|nr:hypothetical protein NDA16_002870 [Ustilago loliicola]
MKFLPLLSAVLLSLAVVRADSPVATGAEKGKIPQLIELINKLENANPSNPAFLADHASEIPQIAKLHREVIAQSGEKSVRKLYGDDAAAQKLLELVEAKAAEKRELKPKKEKKNKANNGKSATHKKETKKTKPAHPEHPAHPTKPKTHGDEVNKGKQGQKQSAAKKPAHAAHPVKPTKKQHKKPAHKHKSKTAKTTEGTTA